MKKIISISLLCLTLGITQANEKSLIQKVNEAIATIVSGAIEGNNIIVPEKTFIKFNEKETNLKTAIKLKVDGNIVVSDTDWSRNTETTVGLSLYGSVDQTPVDGFYKSKIGGTASLETNTIALIQFAANKIITSDDWDIDDDADIFELTVRSYIEHIAKGKLKDVKSVYTTLVALKGIALQIAAQGDLDGEIDNEIDYLKKTIIKFNNGTLTVSLTTGKIDDSSLDYFGLETLSFTSTLNDTKIDLDIQASFLLPKGSVEELIEEKDTYLAMVEAWVDGFNGSQDVREDMTSMVKGFVDAALDLLKADIDY